MKEVSCMVIDDSAAMVKRIEGVISENFPKIVILHSAADIRNAKQQLTASTPDFVILDINLADGSAFELLEALGEVNFKIVFITSHDKYAVRAFRYSALDFLLKPFTDEDLILAMKKVLQELGKENYQMHMEALFHNLRASKEPKKLVLKNVDSIHLIQVDTIMYVQSDNNYSTFFISDGKKIVVSKTLKFFEEQLKEDRFFRTHQRFLINLSYIKSFDKRNDLVILEDEISVPVSQRKKQALLNFLDAL